MTRRVVFAGGIQARALAKAYRLDIAADRDEDVFFIGAEAMGREAAHRVIAAADIVVTDLTESGETIPDHLIPTSAECLSVPVVRAPFLWPFAGRPHPQNRGSEALKDGPYPADFGDSFLDSMIAQGVDEHEAVERYLALDIGYAAQLDEKLTSTLSRLAALDAQSGFDMASYVESEFRSQNLFASTERLRLPLFRYVAAQTFRRMGVDGLRAEALLEAPFLPGAMPIHPGVLRHFGMAAPMPDHRYPVLDEGTFTFEQYCRRYMRFEWNERLHRAMAMAESDPAQAIPMLRAALDISPGSRAGQLALEEAERALAESRNATPLSLGQGSQQAASAPAASHSSYTPIYAAVDSPMPDHQATSGLMPGSLPPGPAMPPPEAAPPQFAQSGLGGLPFTPPGKTAGRGRPGEGQNPPAPFGKFAAPSRPANMPAPDLDDDLTDSAGLDAPAQIEAVDDVDHDGDQKPYVELGFADPPEPSRPQAPMARNRYEPLPPSAELIEVLPRMLPSTRGLTSNADRPFSAMPETMPPPPLRPVLPPELQPEFDDKRGLVARLFGGSR